MMKWRGRPGIAVIPLSIAFVLLNARAEEALWRAGAAAMEITPERPLWMAGYASRTEPADGKLTDLWCKSLVLEDEAGQRGVVVTLDLIGIGFDLAEVVSSRLRKDHGFARSEIVLSVSHTHSGPVVGKNLGPLHYLLVDEEQRRWIDEYADSLVETIAKCVGAARADLRPRRLQWGSGKTTFAVNRRNNKPYEEVPARRERGELAGPVDHDVPVLGVRDPDGRLVAVLFGYACHATVLGLQQWCGDYPGYAQIALEEAHPECVALFWAGCGGDQNPLPRKTVERARHYGKELAAAVEDVLAAPMPRLAPVLETRFRVIELPLADLPSEEHLRTTARGVDRFEVARAKYLLRKMEVDGGLRGHYPYPVGIWRLGGEIDWVTLGGETVVDYALRLKEEGRGIRTWVAGYCHDVMAYIPSLRVLLEGGYEGGGSNVYYGLPSLWSERVEETIIEAVSGSFVEQ